MAYTYKQAFAPAALGAGNVTAYTVPVGTTSQLRAVTAHNPTAAPITLTANIVPSAGSFGTTNKLLSFVIGAGRAYLCPELINQTMQTGDALVFSGENLNVMVSVAEVV